MSNTHKQKEILCPACNQANCYGHHDYEFECDCGAGNYGLWRYGNNHNVLCNKITKQYAPAKGTT